MGIRHQLEQLKDHIFGTGYTANHSNWLKFHLISYCIFWFISFYYANQAFRTRSQLAAHLAQSRVMYTQFRVIIVTYIIFLKRHDLYYCKKSVSAQSVTNRRSLSRSRSMNRLWWFITELPPPPPNYWIEFLVTIFKAHFVLTSWSRWLWFETSFPLTLEFL